MRPSNAAISLTLCLLAASYVPPPLWGAQFPESFVVSCEEAFSADYAAADREDGSDVPGEHQTGFRSWRFRSREKVPGTAPPLYRRFRLRFYSFDGEARRDEAFAALAARVQGDMYYKSPLFVIATGTDLFRLDGECAWPKDEWEAVETKLASDLYPGGIPPGTPSLKILCGGAVTLSPASIPGP